MSIDEERRTKAAQKECEKHKGWEWEGKTSHQMKGGVRPLVPAIRIGAGVQQTLDPRPRQPSLAPNPAVALVASSRVVVPGRATAQANELPPQPLPVGVGHARHGDVRHHAPRARRRCVGGRGREEGIGHGTAIPSHPEPRLERPALVGVPVLGHDRIAQEFLRYGTYELAGRGDGGEVGVE